MTNAGAGASSGGANRRKNSSNNRNREREKDTEWQERVIQIRRVTKVVKGGKKLSFRAVVVVGNEKGQVGVGVGKAADVVGAVRKGVADGKKHLVTVPITRSDSIPQPIHGIAGAARVMTRPAAPGTGVIAGGAVRTVLELAGVKNVLAKQLGSSNPLNNARATLNALANLRTLGDVATERGIPLEQLYG